MHTQILDVHDNEARIISTYFTQQFLLKPYGHEIEGISNCLLVRLTDWEVYSYIAALLEIFTADKINILPCRHKITMWM